jgi:hypothetical protein
MQKLVECYVLVLKLVPPGKQAVRGMLTMLPLLSRRLATEPNHKVKITVLFGFLYLCRLSSEGG